MKVLFAAALALAVSLPAQAHGLHERDSSVAVPLLEGLVHEEDIGLVFDYLREAIRAAAEGREAPIPDELGQRGERIADALKRRGAAAGNAMLDALERMLRERLRERPRLPEAPAPLQRI